MQFACLVDIVHPIFVIIQDSEESEAIRLQGNRSGGISIALAAFEHGCKLLVDLMYVVSGVIMSIVRLHNQEVSLHHIQEVMNEPRTIRMGTQFPDELD